MPGRVNKAVNGKQKLLSIIPAWWASLFDIIVTIVHQPDEYWSGDLTTANEGNPFGKWMMGNHVSGIFVISAFWLLMIGLLGYYLPRVLSKIFLVFVLTIHGWGAATWIGPRYGFWAVVTLFLLNAILFGWVDKQTARQIDIHK